MLRTILIIGAVVCALASMPAAAADPPETVSQDGTFDITIPDCGFDIRVTGETNGFVRIFDDWEGLYVERATASIHATLTNLETGASIDRNISGPGFYTEYPDGAWTYTMPGPSLFWEFGDPRLPAVFLNQGRMQFVGDADSQTYTRVGRVEDICAALS